MAGRNQTLKKGGGVPGTLRQASQAQIRQHFAATGAQDQQPGAVGAQRDEGAVAEPLAAGQFQHLQQGAELRHECHPPVRQLLAPGKVHLLRSTGCPLLDASPRTNQHRGWGSLRSRCQILPWAQECASLQLTRNISLA